MYYTCVCTGCIPLGTKLADFFFLVCKSILTSTGERYTGRHD